MEISSGKTNWLHLPATKILLDENDWPCLSTGVQSNQPKIIQPKIIPLDSFWKTLFGITTDELCYYSSNHACIFYNGKPFDQTHEPMNSEKATEDLRKDSWTVVLRKKTRRNLIKLAKEEYFLREDLRKKELAKQTALFAMKEYLRRKELRKKPLAKTEEFFHRNTIGREPGGHYYFYGKEISSGSKKKIHFPVFSYLPKKHNQRHEKKHYGKQHYTERNDKTKNQIDFDASVIIPYSGDWNWYNDWYEWFDDWYDENYGFSDYDEPPYYHGHPDSEDDMPIRSFSDSDDD
jgi:hypothetical protein